MTPQIGGGTGISKSAPLSRLFWDQGPSTKSLSLRATSYVLTWRASLLSCKNQNMKMTSSKLLHLMQWHLSQINKLYEAIRHPYVIHRWTRTTKDKRRIHLTSYKGAHMSLTMQKRHFYKGDIYKLHF